MTLQRFICWIAVYCGYLACVGTATTEGWWETGWLHQPDPSCPHGQTQTVPGEDRVSARKLSELSVVRQSLCSETQWVKRCVTESLLRNSVSQALCDRVSAQKLSESYFQAVWECMIQVFMYLTLCCCLLPLCSKSSGSEWLAMSELYSVNNYNFMWMFIFCLLYDGIEMSELEECYEYELT